MITKKYGWANDWSENDVKGNCNVHLPVGLVGLEQLDGFYSCSIAAADRCRPGAFSHNAIPRRPANDYSSVGFRWISSSDVTLVWVKSVPRVHSGLIHLRWQAGSVCRPELNSLKWHLSTASREKWGKQWGLLSQLSRKLRFTIHLLVPGTWWASVKIDCVWSVRFSTDWSRITVCRSINCRQSILVRP